MFPLRPRLLAACLTLSIGLPAAHGAEIVLEASGVQKLVAQSLYRDNGRYYLSRAPCAAYLEHPVVTLKDGRIHFRSDLGGRLGANVNGSCLGVALATWAVVSGVPRAQGASVRLADVRVEEVPDPNLRLLLDSGLLPSLPQALDLDVRRAVQGMLQGAGGTLQSEVQQLDIQAVDVSDGRLSVRFDFRLLGR